MSIHAGPTCKVTDCRAGSQRDGYCMPHWHLSRMFHRDIEGPDEHSPLTRFQAAKDLGLAYDFDDDRFEAELDAWRG